MARGHPAGIEAGRRANRQPVSNETRRREACTLKLHLVKEMIVELKAVKPIREPKAELQTGYRIEINLA